jgi:hypothetical protein
VPDPPHFFPRNKVDPSLAAALARVAKQEPVLRADAVALRRQGDRVLVVGSNDDSHYYAAAELPRRWGYRWYLPTPSASASRTRRR